MHEFSLATEIVEIVEQSARNAGKTKVTHIELEIGELSGVEEHALFTALDSLTENTILETAEIKVKHTQGKAICRECQLEFKLSDMFILCPKCNGFYKDIISGKEFNVLTIEAE